MIAHTHARDWTPILGESPVLLPRFTPSHFVSDFFSHPPSSSVVGRIRLDLGRRFLPHQGVPPSPESDLSMVRYPDMVALREVA